MKWRFVSDRPPAVLNNQMDALAGSAELYVVAATCVPSSETPSPRMFCPPVDGIVAFTAEDVVSKARIDDGVVP